MSAIKDHPLVSVVIPAFNAGTFLGDTLKSVLSQTHENIEILVVDDGSVDQTPEIVRSFARQDNRVVLLQQKNKGVAAARNLGIEESRGEFIAPLDADDIWYPEKLRTQVERIQGSDASVALVYSLSVDIDEEGKILHPKGRKFYYSHRPEGDVLLPLIYFNFLGNASVPLIRRSCLEKIGTYDTRLKQRNAQGCEDWDLCLRIAEKYRFRFVPQVLVGYRQLQGSMGRSFLSMAKSYDLVMRAAQERLPGVPQRVYDYSRGNFYFYLAGQSSVKNAPLKTFSYLHMAMYFDKMILLRRGLHGMCLKSAIKIFLKLTLGERVFEKMFLKKRLLSGKNEVGIDEVMKNIQFASMPRLRPYDWIVSRRWSRIQKLNHAYRGKGRAS